MNLLSRTKNKRRKQSRSQMLQQCMTGNGYGNPISWSVGKNW